MGRLHLSAVLVLLGGLAGLAPAGAQSGAITIDAQFQEAHVRLDDPARRPIVWSRHVVVVLSGGHSVQEQWDASSNGGLSQGGSNDGALGAAAGDHVWHVLGPSKLVRIQTFAQHTMTMTIAIRPGNRCALGVAYRLKRGFGDMYVPNARDHRMTHFSLPRTLSSSCSIG